MGNITREEIQQIISGYDLKNITIGVLGSHSAEEVITSAKSWGFPTLVVCQKGRETQYVRDHAHLIDVPLVLPKFSDLMKEENQEILREHNTIFIPNRSFSVYMDEKRNESYRKIEQEFLVPIYGNRSILRAEDRSKEDPNFVDQYKLLEIAGIPVPKTFKSHDKIDRLVIVKVQQKNNPLERAFFYATNGDNFQETANQLIEQDIIDEKELKNARIEEYVLGPKYNANYQAYALSGVFGDISFVGFDDRRQSNLGGVRDLTAWDQLELKKIKVPIKNEEVGHFGVTMRESIKDQVYDYGHRFVEAVKNTYPPGMIGLFALQGALMENPETHKGQVFYVFDVSPRIPGCPCVGPTSPEFRKHQLQYQHLIEGNARDLIQSPLDLCMMEILYAIRQGKLSEIVT